MALQNIPKINEVIIVTGYKSELVEQELMKIRNNFKFNIITIKNNEAQDLGIVNSLYITLPYINCEEILRLDGDLLFSEVGELIRFSNLTETSLAVQKCIFEKGTTAIVNQNNLSLISIELIMSGIGSSEWACLDLYYNNDYKKMLEAAHMFLEKKYNYLDLINYSLSRIKINCSEVFGVFEIDTREDFVNATNKF